MYIIRRVDQGGGYVAKAGMKESYTFDIKKMRKFSTRAEAQKELCIENEVVEPIENVMD